MRRINTQRQRMTYKLLMVPITPLFTTHSPTITDREETELHILRLTCWAAAVVQGRVSPLAALQTGVGRHSVENTRVRLNGALMLREESGGTSCTEMQNSLSLLMLEESPPVDFIPFNPKSSIWQSNGLSCCIGLVVQYCFWCHGWAFKPSRTKSTKSEHLHFPHQMGNLQNGF